MRALLPRDRLGPARRRRRGASILVAPAEPAKALSSGARSSRERDPMSVSNPVRLASASGLAVELAASGAVRRIDHRDVIVNLFLGTEVEGGPANLYLRRHAGGVAWVPLLGPQSPGRIRLDETGL